MHEAKPLSNIYFIPIFWITHYHQMISTKPFLNNLKEMQENKTWKCRQTVLAFSQKKCLDLNAYLK